jgi:hypothetical protein
VTHRAAGVYHSLVGLLDREEVRAFQGMYYLSFMAGAILLVLLPHADAGIVDDMLGQDSYHVWLAINIICPLLTLIGRRLTTLAARKAPGESNSAWGAAWMQLAGDFGVWSGVNVFVYEQFRYDVWWWREDIYIGLFLLMGVLGGAMFTFRSVRRLVSVKRKVLDERHHERDSG